MRHSLGRHCFNAVLLSIGLMFLIIFPVYAGTTAGEYLQNGNDFFRQGNLDQAIYEYTKAIDANPNLAKAYNNRGVSYAQEGSLPRAIADFTLAIACKPKDAEAYNNRGHAYAEKGDLIQAISDFTMAININAVYLKAYKNREIVYYDLGKYDKAWADVFKVEELGGKVDPDFYKALKKATDQKK